MEDEKIVELYWNRSEDAIEQSEKRYGRYLHSIAYGILSSHEDAKECVNDTLYAAWQSIPPQKPTRLAVFLGKIVRNKAINRLATLTSLKRNAKMLDLLDEMTEILPVYQNGETLTDELILKDALDRFLASLPVTTRKIFVQRYWYCRSVKEIASEMGMRANNVSVLLHRTREDCRRYLEAEGVAV